MKSRACGRKTGLACLAVLVAGALGCESDLSGAPIPVAVASADRIARVGGDAVILDGTASFVPGSDAQPDAFQWSVSVAPQGADGVGIADPGAAYTEVHVQHPGLYVLRLDVTHAGRPGRPAYVNLRAVDVFLPPVAVAGPDRVVGERVLVVLDGSGSFDPDGGPLTHAWTQQEGPGVVLSDADEAIASFVSPRVEDATEFVFALQVTDDRGLTDTDTVRITVEPSITGLDVVVQPPSTVGVGGTFAVSVAVVDADGAVVPFADDSVTLALATGPADASLTGTLTREAEEGVAVFDDLAVDRLGSYTLRATAPDLEESLTGVFEVIAGPPAGEIVLVAEPAAIPADGNSRTSITSEPMEDILGNTVPDGTLVTLESDLGTFDLIDADPTRPGLQVASVGGVITFDLVSGTVAGPATVTARAVGRDTEGQVTVAFLPGPPTGAIPLAAVPGQIPADGNATTTVTGGPIRDANGNLVADGIRVTITADAGTVASADADPGTPGVQVLVEDGHLEAVVRAGTEAGTMSIHAATIEGDAEGETSVTLQAGFAVGEIALTVDPAVLTADGVSESTIESGILQDSEGNPVEDGTLVSLSVDGDAVITTPDATPGNPADHTVATVDGAITFQVRAGTSVGEVRIDALSGTATGDVTLTLVAGPPAALVPVDGDGQTGTVGQALDDPLVVRVVDAQDNPVQGVTVRWIASAGGGDVSASTTESGADGLAQVTATLGTVAGAQSFVAEAEADGDGGGSLTGSPVTFAATAVAGAPDAIVIDGLPAETVAGAEHTVTVTVHDAWENVVTDYEGTVTFSSNDGRAILPDPVSFTVADEGSKEVSQPVVLRTAGIRHVHAEDAVAAIDGRVSDIQVSAADPDQVVITDQPNGAVGAGATFVVGIEVRDAYGNVADYDGSATIRIHPSHDPGGTLSGTTPVAVTGGLATFDDLSIAETGEGYRLGVTVGDFDEVLTRPFDVGGALSVDAGDDIAGVFPWDTVHLAATALGGTPPYTYTWRVIGVPSVNYRLGDDVAAWPGGETASGPTPVFWPRRARGYTVEVEVGDSDGRTVTDQVEVTVIGFGSLPNPGPNASWMNIERLAVRPDTGHVAAALTTQRGAIWHQASSGDWTGTPVTCAAHASGSAITVAPDGIGTPRFFIGHLHQRITRVRYDPPEGIACVLIDVSGPLPDNTPEVYGLATRENGDVWIATEADLTRLPAGAPAVSGHYRFDDPDETYRGIAFAHPSGGVERLFVGDDGQDYFRTDPDAFDPGTSSSSLPGNSNLITYIQRGAYDPAAGLSEIWFASDGSGVFRLLDADDPGGTVVRFTTSDGLPHNEVRQLAFDDVGGGDVWIATRSGLARWKRDVDAIVVPNTDDGVCSEDVRAVAVDNFDPAGRGRRLYVGCQGALNDIGAR